MRLDKFTTFQIKNILHKKDKIKLAICFFAGAIIMLGILKAYAYNKKMNKTKTTFKKNKSNTFYCKTDTAFLAPIKSELYFNGIISFDENATIQIFPLVSGTIENVDVGLGCFVNKGKCIAKIRSRDLCKIQNDYRIAKVNYELAKNNTKIGEALYNSNFSSKSDILTLKKEFVKAKNKFRSTKDICDIYGASKASNPIYNVLSPINGYIIEKNINSNIHIRPDNNNPIFTISDLKKIWVLMNVYEDDISMIKVGEDVTVTTMAYPGKEFKGKIINTRNVLDKKAKVLKAIVELDNSELLLKPDMFSIVKLQIVHPQMALAVNLKSLIFDNDKYYIIVAEQGKYKIHSVSLIKTTSQYAYLNNGVKSGDTIVVEKNLLLFNELKSNIEEVD